MKNPEGNLSKETQEKIKNLEQSLEKWSQNINSAKEKLAKLPAGENEEVELTEVAELVSLMSKECEEAERVLSDAVYEEMYWDSEQSMGRSEENNQEYKSEGYQKWVNNFFAKQNETPKVDSEKQDIVEQIPVDIKGNEEEDMGQLDEKFLAEDFDKMAPVRINELLREIEDYNKNAPLLEEKIKNLNSYKSETKQKVEYLRRDISRQKASDLEQEMASKVNKTNEEINLLKHLVAVGKEAVLNGEATLSRYERALKNRRGEINLSDEEKNRIQSQIEELHEKVKNLQLN